LETPFAGNFSPQLHLVTPSTDNGIVHKDLHAWAFVVSGDNGIVHKDLRAWAFVVSGVADPYFSHV
jgi:hypothetical protein